MTILLLLLYPGIICILFWLYRKYDPTAPVREHLLIVALWPWTIACVCLISVWCLLYYVWYGKKVML